ncbi:hypothetical protein BH23BAC3_BH23BAC3_22430 [soil metagenome]
MKKLTSELANLSVIQIINTLLHTAIEQNVSDIHLEPFEDMFRVRFRLDGVLQDTARIELYHREAVISRVKIMGGLDIAEKRRPQDGRIRLDRESKAIDLRVSSLPTVYGEKIVLRVLDKGSLNLNLKELGFEEQSLVTFRRNIQLPYGMILVTGPTGSGKTTTLYSALNELNTEHVNITTIEDPIEYNLNGITQTQVHNDIGLSFSAILRSILRQDPNIVMLGEIRDGETAKIATRAALTGHMVLSTLHTNDAPSAVARLKDVGVESFLIASSVRMIVAQRLVRRICPNCKEARTPLERELKSLKLENFDGQVTTGAGCDQCNQTGFRGRVSLFEIMEIDEQISKMIAKGTGSSYLKNAAKKAGLKTLREVGLKKIKQGITTPDEVLRETTI